MRQRLPLFALLALLPLVGCPKSTPPSLPAAPSGTTPTTTKANNPNAVIQATSADDPLGIFGNPDGATNNPRNPDHYLLPRREFTLSYNDSLRFPNWVAWRLDSQDIGDTDRGNFTADPDLPESFEHITTRDYSGTGYDRGHNCPSKDRSASRAVNDVAFYMSNITPQRHTMNAGPWENLESYCRKLAQEGNELYILCGHGFDSKDPARAPRIGRSQITVPDFGWKIVVVLPKKRGGDAERVAADTRVIAVKMPNEGVDEHDAWDKYLTTPAAIEQATDLTFFANLPQEVATALKQKQDTGVNSFSGGTARIKKGRR